MDNTIPFKIRNNKVAILVDSPFQALCAIEAINYFNIIRPYFFCHNTEQGHIMTHSYLRSRGYNVQLLEDSRNATQCILSNLSHEKFDCFIIGDYFCKKQFLLSLVWSNYKSRIIYVDDGNSTLSLAPRKKQRFIGRGTIHTILFNILLFIERLKLPRKSFFSIFDINGKVSCPVINNDFRYLSKSHSGFNSNNGIFIVGTNTSMLGWECKDFENKLVVIKEYYGKLYPYDRIFFCPHRRDANNYERICKHLSIELFDTQVSVEVDFLSKDICPKVIIGFGSTALFTMHKLFNSCDVIDISMICKDQELQKEYKTIEQHYREVGIHVLSLEDLRI